MWKSATNRLPTRFYTKSTENPLEGINIMWSTVTNQCSLHAACMPAVSMSMLWSWLKYHWHALKSWLTLRNTPLQSKHNYVQTGVITLFTFDAATSLISARHLEVKVKTFAWFNTATRFLNLRVRLALAQCNAPVSSFNQNWLSYTCLRHYCHCLHPL